MRSSSALVCTPTMLPCSKNTLRVVLPSITTSSPRMPDWPSSAITSVMPPVAVISPAMRTIGPSSRSRRPSLPVKRKNTRWPGVGNIR